MIHPLTCHPLRMRIVRHAATRGTVTPKDLAEAFEASLGVVSYHVRQLQRAGVRRLHHTEPVRGTLSHHYTLNRGQIITALGEIEDEIGEVRAALHREAVAA